MLKYSKCLCLLALLFITSCSANIQPIETKSEYEQALETYDSSMIIDPEQIANYIQLDEEDPFIDTVNAIIIKTMAADERVYRHKGNNYIVDSEYFFEQDGYFMTIWRFNTPQDLVAIYKVFINTDSTMVSVPKEFENGQHLHLNYNGIEYTLLAEEIKDDKQEYREKIIKAYAYNKGSHYVSTTVPDTLIEYCYENINVEAPEKTIHLYYTGLDDTINIADVATIDVSEFDIPIPMSKAECNTLRQDIEYSNGNTFACPLAGWYIKTQNSTALQDLTLVKSDYMLEE